MLRYRAALNMLVGTAPIRSRSALAAGGGSTRRALASRLDGRLAASALRSAASSSALPVTRATEAATALRSAAAVAKALPRTASALALTAGVGVALTATIAVALTAAIAVAATGAVLDKRRAATLLTVTTTPARGTGRAEAREQGGANGCSRCGPPAALDDRWTCWCVQLLCDSYFLFGRVRQGCYSHRPPLATSN